VNVEGSNPFARSITVQWIVTLSLAGNKLATDIPLPEPDSSPGAVFSAGFDSKKTRPLTKLQNCVYTLHEETIGHGVGGELHLFQYPPSIAGHHAVL
jgi:hypothetical protein